MIRILSVLAVAAVAVREELSSLVEVEVDEEMKLVPAKISKAIRSSMRRTAEAVKVAEEMNANATAAAEAAEAKATEADTELEKANKMKEEQEEKARQLQEVQAKAQEKMQSKDQAAAAFNQASEEEKSMADNYDAEEKKYNELSARVAEEMKRLAQQKTAANLALAQLRKAWTKQKENVEKLASETAAQGNIAQAALQEAEVADAAFREAENKCQAQKSAAETAQTEAAKARQDSGLAKDQAAEAAQVVQDKTALKDQILALRDSVQTYYNGVGEMTKSMEATLEENEGKEGDAKKAPWELMREEPNAAIVKKTMVDYNIMVGQFRRLFYDEKSIFDSVEGSITEIKENAQAALLLQCDPNEELEQKVMKATADEERTAAMAELNQKCGSGLWEHNSLERSSFPSESSTPATESNEASTTGSTEPTTEATTDSHTGLIQLADLRAAREIRRHRA
mmetsp:Transcript_69426/g.165456  ORF Transcript_69426/g.165456 Transcript_69426/m.165456 type:complete len:455 (+) Transcript_69426:85-1449(+)|eukprot:CAMPEP_0181446886 /NCGR_PEP_ID=MMETSP1110-20121109/26339_1 /TAXON_ID=174948 /ORGANISM="Symbiodinium sp., Strain CCMP421" /LENGTH=454 /DNA_ID=CAMNT_0023570985 /DNA_START=85 /DNA_END=1449 /DNA_ORIENTATION=-